MDDAKVLQACRLLHEALCDDLELRQLLVQIDRDRVSITIHQKRGGRESKVIIGEDPPDNTFRLTSGGSSVGRVFLGRRSG